MFAAGQSVTLAERLGASSRIRDAVLVLASSFAIGLLAQAEIRLPWTPVPVTLQPLAVFLLGAALGSRRAAITMLVYLAEGAAGLPFFAGGTAGLARLLGPTGGYLVGFVPAAFVIGFLAEHGWDRTPHRAFAAMFLGSIVLFGCGLARLAAFVPREQLLSLGLAPFVVGDLLKMLAAAGLLPALWKLLERGGFRPSPTP
jgi:biotin transport system substrate-specific component